MAKGNFFLLLGIMLVFSVQAQDKLLNSNQLMDGTLYPSRIRSVQFVGKTNNIACVRNNALYVGNSSSQKETVKLDDLNKAFGSLNESELKNFPNIRFTSEKEFTFVRKNVIYLYNTKTKTLSKLATYDGNAQNIDIERKHYQIAYTIGNSLYVNSLDKVSCIGEGGEGIVYGQSVHRSEFGIEKGTFWSPEGNMLAFYRMDESMVTEYPKVNTATRIATAEPFRYPMAGMKSHEVTIGIYNTLKGNTIYLNTRKDTSVAERENYLTNLTWSPDEKHIYIAKINREQNHAWMEKYNAETGELEKVLFEETNERYTEPVDGFYFLPGKTQQFLWLSYRDGYMP